MLNPGGNWGSGHVLMGLQHMFVMFGATVLVPLLTGLDTSVALFASGAGTLIFHALTGFQVPVYLGSSFAFIPVILAISGMEGGSLALACGGLAVAGLFYLVVALLFRLAGQDLVHRIIPAQVSGPMIILIGLILAPVAVQNASGANSQEILAAVGTGVCWGLAALTFAVAVFTRVHLRRWGFVRLSTLPVMAALAAGYTAALLIGIVDLSGVQSAAWLGLPRFTAPEFSLAAATIAVPVALVTVVEHMGDMVAVGSVVDKDFVAKPGLHRTLLGDGLATSLAALLGGPANTTYSENTGALALTGYHHPSVMRIAALFAILFSCVPKFSAVITSIPGPVIGGISILLFGMIASIGMKTMIDQRVDLSRPAVLVVVSVMMVLGLGAAEVAIGSAKMSGLGLAAVAGILINLALSGGRNAVSHQ